MAPLSTATFAEFVSDLQEAITSIPDLRIYVRDHCHGHDWMINPETVEVHLNGQLDPAEFGYVLAEALAALQMRLCAAPTPIAGGGLDELAERRASGRRS